MKGWVGAVVLGLVLGTLTGCFVGVFLHAVTMVLIRRELIATHPAWVVFKCLKVGVRDGLFFGTPVGLAVRVAGVRWWLGRAALGFGLGVVLGVAISFVYTIHLLPFNNLVLLAFKGVVVGTAAALVSGVGLGRAAASQAPRGNAGDTAH